MSYNARIIIFVMGAALFCFVFELVRRRRFREELSLTWFAVSILVMASSFGDLIVDPIARFLGIGYPPALVFAWIIFGLVVALLHVSAVISDLKGKIKELSQKIALMESEVSKEDPGENQD
jgi:hypothetical protein